MTRAPKICDFLVLLWPMALVEMYTVYWSYSFRSENWLLKWCFTLLYICLGEAASPIGSRTFLTYETGTLAVRKVPDLSALLSSLICNLEKARIEDSSKTFFKVNRSPFHNIVQGGAAFAEWIASAGAGNIQIVVGRKSFEAEYFRDDNREVFPRLTMDFGTVSFWGSQGYFPRNFPAI